MDHLSAVPPQPVNSEVDEAGRRAELAVAEARASGTPEAWKRAVDVVAAVGDVVEATTAMHNAVRAAREAQRAAQAAADAAKVARQQADDVKNRANDAEGAAQTMEKAIARAQEVDTPKGWSEAVQIARGLGVPTETDAAFSDLQPPPPSVEQRLDAANGGAPPPPPPPPPPK
jgi:hypothetical protein